MKKAVIVDIPENCQNDLIVVYNAATNNFKAIPVAIFLAKVNSQLKVLLENNQKTNARMDNVVDKTNAKLSQLHEAIQTEINIREGDNEQLWLEFYQQF